MNCNNLEGLGTVKNEYVGNVKPHVEIDKMALKVAFGEIVTLEDWQINHPEFQFALKHGWVLSTDQKTLTLNTPEASAKTMFSSSKEAATAQAESLTPKVVQSGIAPELLKDTLDRQNLMMQTLVEKVQPSDSGALVAALTEMVQQQKKLLEAMNAPKPAADSGDMVALLKEIKDSLANQKPTVVYNNQSDAPKQSQDGFKVVEVEAERFVPKVEDLNAKTSTIVTQQHSSGSTDDALAALKNLKGKK